MSGRRRAKVPIDLPLPIIAALLLIGCRNDPEGLVAVAKAEWAASRPAGAEEALVKLAAIRPLSASERLLRAQALRELGRIADAVAALDGEPGEAVASIEAAQGSLEIERFHLRDAEAALQRALRYDMGLKQARRDLIDIYAAQGRGPEVSAQIAILAGMQDLTFSDLYLWTLGRREDATSARTVAALERAIAADPDDRHSRLALVAGLRHLGQLDAAFAILEALPPSDVEATIERARIAIDNGDDLAVRKLLSHVTQGTSAGDHEALGRAAEILGRLALVQGQADEASRWFRQAVKALPDDRDALYGLGQSLRLAGKDDEADTFVRAAAARDHLVWLVENARPPSRRDDVRVLREVGDACAAMGRRDQARAWYRKALAGNPLDAELQKTLFRLDHAPPVSKK
jgi:tetratricopeptide (TPR) repeat protein